MRPLLTAALLVSLPAFAAIKTQKVPYSIEGTAFEGVLVYDDAKTVRPGIVLVPNWLGITEANVKQAELVASHGYVVFVADMYGKEARPKTMEEAGKVSDAVKSNRPVMRARVTKALDVFLAQKGLPLDAKKVGAIGFCFGGTSALELARTGAKLGGVVSFHGGLSNPTPADAKKISAKVLVLHGADDPYVPPAEVAAFETEMHATKVDWQLVKYSGTVHSFTDPDAKKAGEAQYNATSAARAYTAMDDFFGEIFGMKAKK